MYAEAWDLRPLVGSARWPQWLAHLPLNAALYQEALR